MNRMTRKYLLTLISIYPNCFDGVQVRQPDINFNGVKDSDILLSFLVTTKHPETELYYVVPIDCTACEWFCTASAVVIKSPHQKGKFIAWCGEGTWIPKEFFSRGYEFKADFPDEEVAEVREKLAQLACGKLEATQEQSDAEWNPDIEHHQDDIRTAVASLEALEYLERK